MIYILEIFKEKYSRRLLLAIVVFGFLFVFFYQVLVDYDFSKVGFKVDMSKRETNLEFYLLSGWTAPESSADKEAIWSKGGRSTVALYLPKKSAYRIRLNVLFPAGDLLQQGIGVFVNKEPVVTLKPKKLSNWQEFQFIIPYNLVSKGFNKIGLVNLSKEMGSIAYKNLEITNYKRIPLAFPGGYILFDKVRWLSLREGVSVNWRLCLFGGFLLPVFWMVYSIWLFSLSEIKFSRILRLDFFTYLPSIIILLAIYLFFRFFLYSTVFTRGVVLLLTIGLTSSTKAYQFYRYAQRPKIKAQIKFLKDIAGLEIVGTMFIVSFMILLFISTLLLVLKQDNIADKVANGAYLALVSGVVLRLLAIRSKDVF